MPDDADAGLVVRTYFVRGRNALLARADFSELYIDYYLHLAQHQIKPSEQNDTLLKELLAALTLHCASRPWNESTAWTVNFQDPLLNLFVTGDNNLATITGTLFTDNIKMRDSNLFCADIVRGRDPARRSVINFEGSNPFQAVETFYQQSEQRLGRYFNYENEDFVLISSQPQCDTVWLENLTETDIRILDEQEELSLLEERRYRWHCGCSQEKLHHWLAPTMKTDAEGLFAGDPSLRIHCPRCGALYVITRESLEAYVSRKTI
jgi:molecular chaperone Hsp33